MIKGLKEVEAQTNKGDLNVYNAQLAMQGLIVVGLTLILQELEDARQTPQR